MRYLPKENMLFLHIPKTGGMSIEKVVGVNYEAVNVIHSRWRGGRHVLKDSLLSQGKIKPEGLKTFTFVRHPLKWYSSTWRYLKYSWRFDVPEKRRRSIIRQHPWHPFTPFIKVWDNDFSKWMERVLEELPAYVTRLFELYCGPEKCEFVDYIGRTESLTKDMEQLFGRKLHVSHRHKSKRHPTDMKIDLQRQVEDMERVAIQRFYGEHTINYRWTEEWKAQ